MNSASNTTTSSRPTSQESMWFISPMQDKSRSTAPAPPHCWCAQNGTLTSVIKLCNYLISSQEPSQTGCRQSPVRKEENPILGASGIVMKAGSRRGNGIHCCGYARSCNSTWGIQDALTAGWGFWYPHWQAHPPARGSASWGWGSHTALTVFKPTGTCRALTKHNPRHCITGLGLFLEEGQHIWRKKSHLRHMA